MNQSLGAAIGAVAVAILVVMVMLALPLLGVSVGPFDDGGSESVQQEDGETNSTEIDSDDGESREDTVEQRSDDGEEREGEASITFDDQASDGESVVVSEVELTEGGFVAVYPSDAADPAAVIGASDSLEAGEHGNVSVDLEEPIESDQSLVAVVHHDTTGNGTFQYAESDGAEDDPYVDPNGSPVLDTALVTVGDGDTSAEPVESDLGEPNETDPSEPNEIDPDETNQGESNEASPNETDQGESNETGPNETDQGEPNATLSVSDQTGDGESLVVDEASADVEYVLSAAYDGNRVDSESVEANETISNETLQLEPSLSENATVDVSIRAADDDTELASDSIEYALEGESDNSVSTANESELAVTDFEIDVGEGNQSNEYVTLQNTGNNTIDFSGWTLQDRLNEGIVDTPGGGSALEFPDGFVLQPNAEVTIVTGSGENTEETLYWGIERPVWNASGDEVVVRDSDGDIALQEPIEAEESNESEPSATLEVDDQTGNGENLTVESANASVEYGLTVADRNGEQRAATDTVAAGEAVSNETLTLEPPLEENSTLDVSVVDGAGTELATDSLEYTLEDEENGSGAPTAFEAEFVDCSRADVTGSFEDGDTIVVATGFYESSGFGNSMGEYAITVGDDVDAPLEGTVTFETGDEFAVTETADGANVTVPEGEFGAAITGIASPDAIAGEIDYPNPQARECLDEVRPERPNISVENPTATDDGIAVTFGYDNPNDAALFADSEFVEGTTDDVPVEELEPGANSFTVEWTPEGDDERLVWEAGLSHYDYEETLTAETPPAGEIQSTAPVNLTNGTEDAPEESETTATQESAGDGATEPQDPAEPTEPADTGESANSTEPAAPTAPAEPTEPTEPAESDPSAESDESEPSEPAESEPSAEPQEPAETQGTSEESTESDAPAEPETPAEPDAPGTETESDENASAA